jgi:Fic family protein
MKTLRQLAAGPVSIPAAAALYLEDLGEARGRQELLRHLAPRRLAALRDHALVESAVSSNRIEGVEVDPARAAPLVLGRPRPRDRSEEEIAGYRDALRRIHEQGSSWTLTVDHILELHRLCRGDFWDAGRFKEKESDILEHSPDGRTRVRFRTVPALEAPAALEESVDLWHELREARRVPPLVLLGAFNLDFLSIHPFRDGNGRVSRLLLLAGCLQLGYEVGRWVSLERLIEENKQRYYETLEESSQGWHQGRHDPWPYIHYLLYILKSAYKEVEALVSESRGPRGSKSGRVEAAVLGLTNEFTLAEVHRACPGVSRDLVRRVLRRLKDEGRVEVSGRGPGARWRKTGGEKG